MENSILSLIAVFCLGIIIGFLIGIFVSKDSLFKLGNLFKTLNIFSKNVKKNSNNQMDNNKGLIHIGDSETKQNDIE